MKYTLTENAIWLAKISVLLSILLLFSWLFLFTVPRSVWAENKCLSLGYPSASVAFTGRVYCIKRVDQTDVVTPLSTLR